MICIVDDMNIRVMRISYHRVNDITIAVISFSKKYS